MTATRCRLLACSGSLNRPDKAEVSGSSPLRPTSFDQVKCSLVRSPAADLSDSLRDNDPGSFQSTLGSTTDLCRSYRSGLPVELVSVDQLRDGRLDWRAISPVARRRPTAPREKSAAGRKASIGAGHDGSALNVALRSVLAALWSAPRACSKCCRRKLSGIFNL